MHSWHKILAYFYDHSVYGRRAGLHAFVGAAGTSSVAKGRGRHGCMHVPCRSWKFFQSTVYTVFAVWNFYIFCSVEYSACVSGFWGLRPQIPTGALPLDPAGGLPSPIRPLLSPVANSWLRPWLARSSQTADVFVGIVGHPWSKWSSLRVTNDLSDAIVHGALWGRDQRSASSSRLRLISQRFNPHAVCCVACGLTEASPTTVKLSWLSYVRYCSMFNELSLCMTKPRHLSSGRLTSLPSLDDTTANLNNSQTLSDTHEHQENMQTS